MGLPEQVVQVCYINESDHVSKEILIHIVRKMIIDLVFLFSGRNPQKIGLRFVCGLGTLGDSVAEVGAGLVTPMCVFDSPDNVAPSASAGGCGWSTGLPFASRQVFSLAIVDHERMNLFCFTDEKSILFLAT